MLAEYKNGRYKFKVNDKPAKKLTDELLQIALGLTGNSDKKTEEIFATEGQQVPNTTWHPDTGATGSLLAELKKEIRNPVLLPRTNDATAEVTFVGAETMNEKNALRLKASVDIGHIAPRMGPLVPTVGDMAMAIDYWLPEDPNALDKKVYLRVTTDLSSKTVRQGQKVEMSLKHSVWNECTDTPVK